jgi:phage host-nuclease inhibitor protein Gam
MNKNRVKKAITLDVSREEMEEAFAQFAAAQADIDSVNADLDARMVQLRNEAAPRLASLEATKKQAFEVMQNFGLLHHDELFSKKKSLQCTHGIIGFRIGTPKLKTRKGFTWAAVLEVARTILPSYIRTTEEVAKDRLLADRAIDGMAEKMDRCGVVVVQEETFYAEPKTEDQDA